MPGVVADVFTGVWRSGGQIHWCLVSLRTVSLVCDVVAHSFTGVWRHGGQFTGVWRSGGQFHWCVVSWRTVSLVSGAVAHSFKFFLPATILNLYIP